MSSIKKLFGQVAVYGLSSILARAVNFLLVPFYTEYLETDVFGVLTMYMTYTAFFLVFLSFGMETSYFRFSNKELEERKAFSQFFTIVFVLALLGAGSLFVFAEPLAQLLGGSGDVIYLRIQSSVIFLDVLFSLSFARLRNLNKGFKFAMVKFTSIGLNVALNLLLVVYLPHVLLLDELDLGLFSLDLSDQVLMILVANLGAASIYLGVFWKDLWTLFRYFDRALFKPILTYAYPIMILGLAGVINELLDRVMLLKLLPEGLYAALNWSTLDAIGVYSANYKFAILVTLGIQAYRYAAEPFFFKKAKDQDSKQTFVQLMNVFVVLLLTVAVMISIFKQELGVIMLRSPEYRQGLSVVPVLLLANVCVGVYYNLSAWYKLTDKTIFGTYIGIGGALITVGLNYVLIPYFGFMGSAYATLVCYFTMMAVSYFFGQRYYPVDYQVGKLLFYSAVAIAVVMVSHFLIEALAFAWVYKTMLTLSFCGLLYVLEIRKWLKG